jgi:hypothetical protein
MISIYLSPREKLVRSVCGGNIHQRLVTVSHENKLVELSDLPFNLIADDVEIILNQRLWSTKLNLCTEIKRAILFYLRSYHRNGERYYDCYTFVSMYKGLERKDMNDVKECWHTSSLPLIIKPSSVVFFTDNRYGYFCHSAIYIGKGLYLSVNEPRGSLCFSSFRSIKRDYHAKNASLATVK